MPTLSIAASIFSASANVAFISCSSFICSSELIEMFFLPLSERIGRWNRGRHRAPPDVAENEKHLKLGAKKDESGVLVSLPEMDANEMFLLALPNPNPNPPPLMNALAPAFRRRRRETVVRRSFLCVANKLRTDVSFFTAFLKYEHD